MAERVLRARLEAETSQFSARFAAAEMQLVRMERAPVAAARGMALMQSGMRALAFQATGVAGPVGVLVQGIGTVAFGSPLILGVLAGVGAVATIIKLLGKDAEESKKRVDSFLQSLADQRLKAALPSVALAAIEGRQAFLRESMASMAGLREKGLVDPIAAAGEIRRIATELASLDIQRRDVMKLITDDAVKQADASAKTATALAKARFEARELRIELVAAVQAMTAGLPSPRLQLLTQLGGGALRGVSPGVANVDLATRAVQLRKIAQEISALDLNATSLALKRKEHEALKHMVSAIKGHADAIEKASLSTQHAAAALIMGVGVAIQGLIGGGGPGGLLGGALGIVGGIVGLSNPVLGALLSAGGGIIATLAAKSRQEPIAVHDRAVRSELHDLRNEIREVLVSISFTGPERALGSIRYGMDRQTRRDAVPRIP